jgi:hypothetical protein
MRVFRRSSGGATDSKATEAEAEQTAEALAKTRPAAQSGKGRPTPKRSEAERNRYRSIQGGTTSGRSAGTPSRPLTKEEKARVRSQAQSDRQKQTEAMRRGEEWALGPRDKGPVRRLTRDYVDSRRRISEYMMYMLIILLAATLSRNTAIMSYTTIVVYVMFAAIILDGFFLSRGLRKLVAERFPGESTRGLTLYAMTRAMYLRRWRVPKPQVKPGAKI